MTRIAFLLEDFAVPSPGQQLLDRFLIGYNHQGQFQRGTDRRVTLWTRREAGRPALEARARDFGLILAGTISEALSGAQAAVVAAPETASALLEMIGKMPPGCRCFVQGVLPGGGVDANRIIETAASRSIRLSSGTATATAFRLPEIEPPRGAKARHALIVAQGDFPAAEIEALEGLFPFLERRAGGETGVQSLQLVRQDIWTLAYSSDWSALLSAALSRSNNIKGDPERDGRTQDIFGLRLLETLAKEPRAWVLRHRDGLNTAIFVLTGALSDINCALRLRDGRVLSTQLYRPPPPMQDHFSALAAALDQFFRTGDPPWQPDKPALIAEILEQMKLKSGAELKAG